MLYDEEQKIFRHRLDVKHGQRVQGKLRVAGKRKNRWRRSNAAPAGCRRRLSPPTRAT